MSDTAIFLFGVVVFGIVLASTLIGFLLPAASGVGTDRQRHTSASTMDSSRSIPVASFETVSAVNGHEGSNQSPPVIRRFSETG